MRSSSYLALALCVLLFATCAEPPTAPEDLAGPDAPLFKPKCDTPPCDGGEDPPPADQVILYSVLDNIFQMNADGTNVEQLTTDAYPTLNNQPAWAPDGEQYTFRRLVRVLERRKVVSTSHQIAVSRVDGNGLTVVREVPDVAEPLYRPRWSPAPLNGVERVAWVEDRWFAGEATIVLARADTWQIETLLTSDPGEHFGNMTWSRTGDQILIEGWYETETPPQLSFLRLYDVDCSDGCTATPAGDLDLSPLSSSDSFGHVDWAHLHDWVLVRAIPAGSSYGDLWRIDMVNGDVVPVTDATIDVQDGVWSSCDNAVLMVVWGQFGRRWSNKLIRLNLGALPSGTPWDGSLDDPSVAEAIGDVNPAGIDWRPISPSGCS